MKQREAKIPVNGKIRLTEAVERLYEATNRLEKVVLWREKLGPKERPKEEGNP
jgi:hypothetical protein